VSIHNPYTLSQICTARTRVTHSSLADLVLRHWGPWQECTHTSGIAKTRGLQQKEWEVHHIASFSLCIFLFHIRTVRKLGTGQLLVQRPKCQVLCEWTGCVCVCEMETENSSASYRNMDSDWEKCDLHQDKLKDKENNIYRTIISSFIISVQCHQKEDSYYHWSWTSIKTIQL
jgi:hypothetical protein